MVTSLLDVLQDCPIPDVGSSFTVTAKCDDNSKVRGKEEVVLLWVSNKSKFHERFLVGCFSS